ncbi:flippase [Empedobacter falsenii]|uniref:flippase n=1 Tax=Empedobacter falsenii TaxID=343874 RepID=UPI0005702BD5|nr:flippase [Empedobacter falsenii]
MKVRSVKTNFILNSLRVFSTAIIGVIMMPYINKTLGVVNLGKVEYSNSIINYFMIFSALGIPIYGIREISKVKDDLYKKTKTVVELLIILFITSILSYFFLFLLVAFTANLHNYKELLLLLSCSIFLTNIGAEWYFQGMEDQKFITIRFLIIRLVTLGLLFWLVKSKEDYLWYALILVLNVCGSNLFNLFYLLKDIQLKSIKRSDINLKRHIKPVLTIFMATISINIYLQLDLILLGSLVGDKYVGLYAASNKLVRFVIIFVTIIGAVLLPRLSSLYVENKQEYFKYLKKAFDLILLFAIPASIYINFFAEEIIYYMAGKEFMEGVLTVKILSPLCVVVGLAYFYGYLVLYVQNQEKIYTTAVVISAIISVIINFFLIKIYYQNGAAFVAVLVEVIAILYMLTKSKKYISEISLLDKDLFIILFANTLLVLILVFGLNLIERSILNLIILITISGLSYICILYLFKQKTIRELIDNFKTKII